MVDFDHGEHAIFDKGLKIELSQTPFHPKRSDLPKLSQRQQLAEELHKEDTEIDKMMETMLEEDEELKRQKIEEFEKNRTNEANENDGDGDLTIYSRSEGKKKNKRNSMLLLKLNAEDSWKVFLAKYLRLPLELCLKIGITESDASFAEDFNHDDDANDDVADVHFVAVTALHVTYVYCCSLLKVFESRENSIGGKPNTDDFDIVYHVVIDAVEEYNVLWEKAMDEKYLSLENQKKEQTVKPIQHVSESQWKNANKDPKDVEAALMALSLAEDDMFASEAEKTTAEKVQETHEKELADATRAPVELDQAVLLNLKDKVCNGLWKELLKLACLDSNISDEELNAKIEKWCEEDNKVYDEFYEKRLRGLRGKPEEKLTDAPDSSDSIGNTSPRGLKNDNSSKVPNEYAMELLYLIKCGNEF